MTVLGYSSESTPTVRSSTDRATPFEPRRLLEGAWTSARNLGCDGATGQPSTGAHGALVRERRPWIVVGYSGANDSVIELLGSVREFPAGLYWVGHGNRTPAQRVVDKVLRGHKGARLVPGHDAQDFLAGLAQGLGCGTPRFAQNPIGYLEDIINAIPSYVPPGSRENVDVMRNAREAVRRVRVFEEKISEARDQAIPHMFSGNFQGVLSLLDRYSQDVMTNLSDIVAWAHEAHGRDLVGRAESVDGLDGERLLEEAIAAFQETVRIESGYFGAWKLLAHAKLHLARRRRAREDVFCLLLDAEKAFLRGYLGIPSEGAYNLACTYALLGREDQCRQHLSDWRALGPDPPVEHALNDEDLIEYRDRDWFRAVVSDDNEFLTERHSGQAR